MNQQKWIGIFQADWPFQVHTINMAIMLAEEGFHVDIFLYKSLLIADINLIKETQNISIHIFDDPLSSKSSKGSTLLRLLNRVSRGFRKALNLIYEPYLFFHRQIDDEISQHLIPNHIRKAVDVIVQDKNYRCLIGVEKLGLVLAGDFAKKLDIPYVYHSLELYTKTHSFYRQSLRNKLLKIVEEKYHQKSDMTIVQDEKRAEILLKDNGLKQASVVYLPVSLLGSIYKERTYFLQKKFNLSNEQLLVLQFGNIRFGAELTQVAQGFPEEWSLVFHNGRKDDPFMKRPQKLAIKNKVKFSYENLDAERIYHLVASAHIGLVLYSNSCENDCLTIFSSEKLALYLQCGIPVIAFDYPGYEFLEQQQCGVLIKEIQDLPNAIKKIASNYEKYRSNAYETFTLYYEFKNNFTKIARSLNLVLDVQQKIKP